MAVEITLKGKPRPVPQSDYQKIVKQALATAKKK